MSFAQLKERYSKTLSQVERKFQRIRFGDCLVKVPKKTVINILMDEILDPFFLFIVFAVSVFLWESYYIYGSTIIALSGGSIFMTVIETRRNNEQIRNMALYTCPVQISQDGKLMDLMSEQLVPGDIVKVPESLVLPCDMILLTGTCIVNESILTGESIPVIKSSLPSTKDKYSVADSSKHTLFGGTSVIQTRPGESGEVLGLVTNTGFLTTKGSLVRDILYPKEIKFQFTTDALKFVAIMFLVAVLGFFGILAVMLNQHILVETFISRTINMITTAVPPALPAAMSCGMIFAIQRLKKSRIFCISPQRVNLAGTVTTFVFDKTGTLTEDGLSVQGFTCMGDKKFNTFSSHFSTLLPDNAQFFSQNDPIRREDKSLLFLEACASCTSITYVNGGLIGDPLDVKMFLATDWVLDEAHKVGNENLSAVYPKVPGANNYKSIIMRRFDFSSAL